MFVSRELKPSFPVFQHPDRQESRFVFQSEAPAINNLPSLESKIVSFQYMAFLQTVGSMLALDYWKTV